MIDLLTNLADLAITVMLCVSNHKLKNRVDQLYRLLRVQYDVNSVHIKLSENLAGQVYDGFGEAMERARKDAVVS